MRFHAEKLSSFVPSSHLDPKGDQHDVRNLTIYCVYLVYLVTVPTCGSVPTNVTVYLPTALVLYLPTGSAIYIRRPLHSRIGGVYGQVFILNSLYYQVCLVRFVPMCWEGDLEESALRRNLRRLWNFLGYTDLPNLAFFFFCTFRSFSSCD